jgi:hypothetical protein
MHIMRKELWRTLGCVPLCAFALNGCEMFHPASPPPAPSVVNASDPAAEAALMQSLQRQIRERDKRIADLRSQLDALKVIDQDIEEQRKSSRPPAMLMPSSAERGR